MKVLKPGNGARSWSTEVYCTGYGNGDGGCGALLRVELTDLFHTYQSYMGREEEWFTTFECPECSVKTDLPPHTSPVRPRDLPSFRNWSVARPPQPGSQAD